MLICREISASLPLGLPLAQQRQDRRGQVQAATAADLVIADVDCSDRQRPLQAELPASAVRQVSERSCLSNGGSAESTTGSSWPRAAGYRR